MVYVILILGFLLLVKGADFFVEGSSSVAKLLRIPSVIIGLTIVAFGTSAPEAAVSITAAISGNNDIAVSNVVGSNIFNLLIVIGICSVILPMKIDKGILKREYPFSIIITALLVLIAYDFTISRLEGALLLFIFVGFVYLMVKSAMKNRGEQDKEMNVMPPLKSAVFIIGGLIAIVVGGDFVVESASKIALSFHLSPTLVGLTIVAVGTSLPELVTSIVAARKGENGLALGNVIGSNIFNILFVLAASAAISPIKVNPQSVIDMLLLIVFSFITWLFSRSKFVASRMEGAIMALLYIAYTGFIILRPM